MARGGKREGSGRKKGSLTKKTQEIVAQAAANGITPLEHMLNVLRDPLAEPTRRDEMAKAAAPYIHSKMPTAVVLPPPPAGTTEQDDEDILKRYMGGLHEEAEQN